MFRGTVRRRLNRRPYRLESADLDSLPPFDLRQWVMFKKTKRQRTFFEVEAGLHSSVRQRLKGTWAEGFQAKVLPVLLDAEEEFCALYSSETGRPNWSVARILGICVLQEMMGLDDQSALDSVAFDVRWQHALGLEPQEAYLSRRSLVEFRSRQVAHDPQMKALRRVFERVGDAAIADLKLSTKEQRLDSTLITSNIYTRGRVELFRKTLVAFVDWLSKQHPERLEKLSESTRKLHEQSKEGGWFGKVDKDKAKQLAAGLVVQLHEVVCTFREDKEIKDTEPYLLVARLISEHCEVERTEKPGEGEGDAGTTSEDPLKVVEVERVEKSGDTDGGSATTSEDPPKLVLLDKPKEPSSSLQSPYDPDAGCGYKGPGYQVQVTETCNNEKAEIITDFEVNPAGVSDRNKDVEILERLSEMGRQPEVLYEDGGYPSGQSIIDAAQKGTEVVAPMTGGSLPENTIGRESFSFDAATGLCTRCPAGHAPLRHDMRSTHHDHPAALHAFFDGEVCRGCALQPRCVARAPNNRKKGNFHLEVSAHLIARDRTLDAMKEDAWWERYKIRAGIEATMSELKRGHGMGKLRVRRMPRVLFAVGMKLTACNVKRWLRVVVAIAGLPDAVDPRVYEPNYACQAPWRLLARLWQRSRLSGCPIAA